MKWSVLSVVTFLCTVFSVRADTRLSELTENYQQPKNILFASMMGGASHVNWVLSILDELSNRGYNITFATSDIHEKFTKPYPHFKTVVIKKIDMAPFYKALDNKKPSSMLGMLKTMAEENSKTFMHDYNALKTVMAEYKIDVALCDLGGLVGCRDAAITNKIPYLTTSSLSFSSDSSAPYINSSPLKMKDSTTLRMSFLDRFEDKFILPAKVIWTLRPKLKQMTQIRLEAGLDTKSDLDPSTHRDSLKLVNSAFGLEAARPLGPLVEFVGPIVPRKYEPLTPELSQFLNTYSRVIYVAFGQHASATAQDKKLLLTAILDAIEEGAFDGFIWAVGRSLTEGFPESIKILSGKVYKIQDILDQVYPYATFLNWAPQTAIVMHPSVSVFITHCGAGSFNEGLYGGKRFVAFPFFGDQIMNAQRIDRNHLGASLNHGASQKEAKDVLVRVGRDTDGVYQKNVDRYKALVQIHSRHGVMRGADLVEEVMYASLDGLLPYRYEDSRYMSFIKAHNIDLYLAALLLASVPLSVLVWGLKKAIVTFVKEKKIKTN